MQGHRSDNGGANDDGFGADDGGLPAAQNATNVELGTEAAAASSGAPGLPPGVAWRLVQDLKLLHADLKGLLAPFCEHDCAFCRERAADGEIVWHDLVRFQHHLQAGSNVGVTRRARQSNQALTRRTIAGAQKTQRQLLGVVGQVIAVEGDAIGFTQESKAAGLFRRGCDLGESNRLECSLHRGEDRKSTRLNSSH